MNQPRRTNPFAILAVGVALVFGAVALTDGCRPADAAGSLKADGIRAPRGR